MLFDGLATFSNVASGIRKGRCVQDGYRRGAGLQFGNLREKVLEDSVYQKALELAEGKTIQDEFCRMNIFLLLKYSNSTCRS